MANSDIEVIGLGSLIGDFKVNAERLNKKDLANAIRPGFRLILKAAKNKAPKRTGTLRKSMRLKVARQPSNVPRATMFLTYSKNYRYKGKTTDPFYRLFVHNGTVNWGGKNRKHRVGEADKALAAGQATQRIKPHPFVAEAFAENAEKAASVILDNISKNIYGSSS